MASATGKLLRGETRDQGFGTVAAQELTSKFVEGRIITICRCKEEGTEHKADLKKMVGVDELWTLCVREPIPGWRLIGRFIGKDCFVVLHPVHRDALAPERAAATFAETISIWKRDFPNREPVRSDDLSAYLSGHEYYDFDQD